jgi:hypothetical protein
MWRGHSLRIGPMCPTDPMKEVKKMTNEEFIASRGAGEGATKW